MATTLATLRTIFYDILREEQDSSAYPLTLTDLLLNAAQQKICFWQITNPFTHTAIRKGRLEFIQTDKFYSNIASTSLSADTTVGATTLTVSDTTNFSSTGVLYIAGNIVTYTGKTSTTFTWCSGVLFAFESWTQVWVAFTLPTDYASILNVTYNNQFKLPWMLFDDIFESLNDYKWTNTQLRDTNVSLTNNPWMNKPFYTIKDGAYLIIFNREQTWWLIRVRYEKVPTSMSSSSDNATIDNDIYAQTTIPYIAVGEMLFNRGEEQRAADILNFGLAQVADMYSYYNDASLEMQSWVHYKMGRGKINI